jgi:hypothetical protein
MRYACKISKNNSEKCVGPYSNLEHFSLLLFHGFPSSVVRRLNRDEEILEMLIIKRNNVRF